MSHLPKDLIAEILSLLPVVILLRLRLVCKPWRALIDSPDFINLHLRRSLRSHVIVRKEHLYSVGFDLLSSRSTVTPAKVEHHPLWCQDYGTEIWGSCNGLLCLSNFLDTLAVWNFSTRKSRKLPYAPIEFKDLNDYVDTRIYGFGYDKISEDYKVVRIVLLKKKDGNVFDNEVKVYSLKSHKWHRAQKIPKCLNLKRTVGVLAAGCLHWVVTEEFLARKGGKIVTFDLAEEVFGTVEQPEYRDMNFLMGLQCLDGCLSISCNYYSDRIDIWVMKEYGVKESWTKLLSIMQKGGPFQYLHPITYSKSGSELLLDQDANKLVWYDMEKKTMRFVKVRGVGFLMQVDICVESLIPLDIVVDRCEKKRQKKEERNMNNFLSKGFKLVL